MVRQDISVDIQSKMAATEDTAAMAAEMVTSAIEVETGVMSA